MAYTHILFLRKRCSDCLSVLYIFHHKIAGQWLCYFGSRVFNTVIIFSLFFLFMFSAILQFFGLGNTFLGGNQIGKRYANGETCLIKSSCKYCGIYFTLDIWIQKHDYGIFKMPLLWVCCFGIIEVCGGGCYFQGWQHLI